MQYPFGFSREYLQLQGDDNVLIPSSLLPELRKLPDDVLSFPKAMNTVSASLAKDTCY